MAWGRLGLVVLAMMVVAAATPAKAATGALNLGVASNYVFRGVSRTDGEARVFGEAEVTAGPLYAGTWLSTVELGEGADVEWGGHAGFRQALGAVVLDLGVVGYGYPDAPHRAGYDNWEVKAAGSLAVGSGLIGAAAFYSPDGFGAAEEALYAEANAAYLVSDRLSLSGAVGRRAAEGAGDYTTWNVGATWVFTPRLTLDLRYHDTDRGDLGKAYGARAVAKVRASFP